MPATPAASRRPDELSELRDAVLAGDRRALAKAITLVESTRVDHRDRAVRLVEQVLEHTGRATRIGISGSPGVGKSTFIEALGTRIVDQGHRLAVLAVDPTSARSGGSILGDKTRMAELGRRPEAFIRPSPGGGQLGGIARRTREALLLCEAAGFDVVIVETIGVGQSEVAVADLVDLFLVLVSPAGGDELQGIKRGIMELADLIVVNKADGDLVAAAGRTVADYRNALGLLRPKWPGWSARVLSVSALTGAGIDEVWDGVVEHGDALASSGERARLRARQALAWMWSEVHDELADRFRHDPAVQQVLTTVESEVAGGRLSPASAARRLLDAFVR
jgi:LAO/AO transport system kinase